MCHTRQILHYVVWKKKKRKKRGWGIYLFFFSAVPFIYRKTKHLNLFKSWKQIETRTKRVTIFKATLVTSHCYHAYIKCPAVCGESGSTVDNCGLWHWAKVIKSELVHFQIMTRAVVKRTLGKFSDWWWLFPRLRGFWENVLPFISRLRFF